MLSTSSTPTTQVTLGLRQHKGLRQMIHSPGTWIINWRDKTKSMMW